MEDYRELGSRYLSRNKKRSLITVIGCFIVATGIFCFLNTMVCWVEKCRIDARKEDDFEIVILTDDKETIEKISNEDFVTSAYLGKEYSWIADDESIYANALHINVKEKFLISHYAKYITKTYGVETELNELLAWSYCQDSEGVGYLMLLGGFFIAFVLAIIGVGVLRNNISISAMERVKDYGNLRCIGATKKQIKAIVYRESVFLESVGIAAGILVGFLLSIPICNGVKMQYPVGFHIIPVIILLIAFYGDMYFAVDDGLKKVLAVSPADAVKGTYRIKQKRIKRRKSGIWGLIFGVEGDYAYKNIKRNNGRFIKTVFAMSFGMIIVIVVGGGIGKIYEYYKDINNMYGYYQQFIECNTLGLYSREEQRADLYSPQALKTISSAKGIGDTKFIYQDTLYFTEENWLYQHMNKEYMEKSENGDAYDTEGRAWLEADKNQIEQEKQERKKYRNQGKGLVDYESIEKYNEKAHRYDANKIEPKMLTTSIDIAGYDEEDYSRYEDYLIEGTTQLSENGVLLVNKAKVVPNDIPIEDASVLSAMIEMQFMDLKVGDEITVVDPNELYNLVQEEKKNTIAYDNLMKEKKEEWDKTHIDEKDKNGNPAFNPYSAYKPYNRNGGLKYKWIYDSAREKLVEEGKYKTYVIEGILSGDPNAAAGNPTIIVPLNKFFAMTGRTEADYTGMKFHVRNILSKDLLKDEVINAINEKQNYYYDGIEENGPLYNSYISPYLELVSFALEPIKAILVIVIVIIVLIFISLLNTLNVNISSLQTRRNEFAQLRSLGMTKKSLLKAVLLEGGIVWIISVIWGMILGFGIEFIMYKLIFRLLISTDMYLFWPGIVVTAILSLVVLVGSNYVFFNQMNLNVAQELTRSGE